MKTDLTVITSIVINFCLILILIEFLYSAKKKDRVYSVSGTIGNFLDYVVAGYISNKTLTFSFTFTLFLFSYLGYTYSEFNVLSFILCLLLIDFLYYILHYLKHKINFLWMFHYVHHSDNKFNMSTFLRASWVEQILFTALPLIIPTLFGFDTYTIIVSSYFLFIFQTIAHSQYIKLPHFVSYIFITPQLHAIHHDQVIKHQNSNFGAIFSIWDRLFGTYVDKIDSFTPGIKGYHQDNFILMQTEPIIDYFKKKI